MNVDLPATARQPPRHRIAQRVRPALLNLGLMMVSLSAALGVAELLIRVILPQQLIQKDLKLWKSDQTLGRVHFARTDTKVNTGERTVRFVTDEEGFRVGAAGRVPAQHRILLLGDSFMEALQVDYEQSVPGLLEQRLPTIIGAPVAVRNTGVGGWSPNNYLVQTQSLLGREEFDLVLVMLFVANDVVPNRTDGIVPAIVPTQVHRLRFPRRLTSDEFINAVFYPVNDFLEVRSHLFTFVKTRFQTTMMQLGLTEAAFQDVFRLSELSAEGWGLTADICEEIARLAEAHDVPTLFVFLPASYQVAPDVFHQYVRGFGIDTATVDLDQPNRILGQAFQKRGLVVIDVLSDFRDAYQNGTGLYGRIDRHFSPAGHDLVEQLIEPAIAAYLDQH